MQTTTGGLRRLTAATKRRSWTHRSWLGSPLASLGAATTTAWKGSLNWPCSSLEWPRYALVRGSARSVRASSSESKNSPSNFGWFRNDPSFSRRWNTLSRSNEVSLPARGANGDDHSEVFFSEEEEEEESSTGSSAMALALSATATRQSSLSLAILTTSVVSRRRKGWFRISSSPRRLSGSLTMTLEIKSAADAGTSAGIRRFARLIRRNVKYGLRAVKGVAPTKSWNATQPSAQESTLVVDGGFPSTISGVKYSGVPVVVAIESQKAKEQMKKTTTE
mmetsp:Transcript_25217/g.81549  ORF Transcript_25217/g.81549 Transcript_25217/m.81549 type:complete len:278 (-) Transcript_25217:1462-2295(-)